jgi:aspartyl-tRNA(Asn)/glutamyl-tRNA(Gln) amidotransferase subunit B
MKIGLEIHVQLPTESKMFCPCPASDNDIPNTHVCPVCLGMPGTLPVMNRKVIELGIRLAKMFNCEISETTWFSRKTYFYPDMSTSVQITQYDRPIGKNGIYTMRNGKKVKISKLQLEQDPGRTKRVGESSLIDYNRCGTPLAEIVTDPDISTPAEAREFLKQMIADIRHVIDLPKDDDRSIRCDCNISVGKERVEVKNVTGLKNVKKALTFEAVRQTKILRTGGKVERETRRFEEERGVTVSARKKEYEADYGYIDEPNLGIFRIGGIAATISIKESTADIAERLSREYGIDRAMADQMVSTSPDLAGIFEKIAKTASPKTALSWTGKISANWKTFEASARDPEKIVDIVKGFSDSTMTDVEAEIKLKAYMTGTDPSKVKMNNADLDQITDEYLKAHPEIMDEIKRNEKAVNRIIGHVMRETGGRYSSADVISAVRSRLGL